MKTWVVLCSSVLLVMPLMTMAQGNGDLNRELDKMYVDSQNAGTPTVATPKKVIVNSGTVNVVETQQAAQAVQVQKHPTMFIEATPMSDSRADRIRQQRQAVETETETKIVEKLEQSRLEDERRRAQALFGGQFEQIQMPAATPVPVVQAPVATPVPAPTPVPIIVQVQQQPAPTPIPLQQPEPLIIVPEKKADDSKIVDKDLVEKKQYIFGMVGFGEYPDTINVRSNGVAGIGIGMRTDEHLMIEGSFIYANYDIEDITTSYYGGYYSYTPYSPYPRIVSMDQYSLALAFKYGLSGRVRPFIGGDVAYSYRSYTEDKNTYFYYTNSGQRYSHAIDLGVVAGADFEVSNSFALGAEFRYNFNVFNRTSSSLRESFVNPIRNGTPIEQIENYTIGITAKFDY